MFTITKKNHQLSTHAEVNRVMPIYEGPDSILNLIKIFYREGQVVDGELVELTSYNKRFEGDNLTVEIKDAYEAVEDKIVWAETLLSSELN